MFDSIINFNDLDSRFKINEDLREMVKEPFSSEILNKVINPFYLFLEIINDTCKNIDLGFKINYYNNHNYFFETSAFFKRKNFYKDNDFDWNFSLLVTNDQHHLYPLSINISLSDLRDNYEDFYYVKKSSEINDVGLMTDILISDFNKAQNYLISILNNLNSKDLNYLNLLYKGKI